MATSAIAKDAPATPATPAIPDSPMAAAATATGPEVPPDTGFDMVLGSNSEMFAQMEAIFKKKELQTLKANFMKVAHDIRMSLIRNIR